MGYQGFFGRGGSGFRFPTEPWGEGRTFSGPVLSKGQLALLVLAGLVVIALLMGVNLYTEWLWFDSLGFVSVFLTTLTSRVALFILGAGLFLVVALVNLAIAMRLAPQPQADFVASEELLEASRWVRRAFLVGAAVMSIIMGAIAANQWQKVLLFLNATPFGREDPLFGHDIGFYVFSLPVYRFAQSWGMSALILVGIGVGLIYGLHLALRRADLSALSTGMKAHLSVLGAAIVWLLAGSYWLDTRELVLSSQGIIFGASFTDVHARRFALELLTYIAALTGVVLLANILLRGFTLPAFSLGVWVVVAILVANIYPALVQRLQVAPNELEKERPYLEQHITMTRQAYALDRIQEFPFPAEEALSREDVNRNPETIQNVRIWDPRPLKDTYNQIQSIRLYYDFADVDIDRYTIDGKYRQVLLSVRELSPERLTAQAQTWVNRHLQFTHGYGVTVSPVNEVSPEGLPNLLVKDVPPAGILRIERPEVYYGEKTAGYVIVNTSTQEFDYPKGEANVYTTYQGRSGVLLDSWLRRLAYAWHFGDINILISEQLTPESRILYLRQIQERVRHIAPFLTLDRDPYIVIAEGRLVWIQDAYTTSDKYPYSEPYRRRLNYIRNSVKVTIDPYDGTVHFYVAEPDDPIVQSYGKIFPALFRPLAEMPASLRPHLRYPEDLFSVQAELYRTYHMRDPRVFYNREDLYNFPLEIYLDKEQPVQPYYVIMRLPGERAEEFLLMQPFTPAGEKNNTIAWLSARSDGASYGKLLAYQFPKEKLVFGPRQVESRIDQDARISQQITLWNQSGSRVIRGNLLMIPVERSFLYVEPLYLQAEKSQLPELKRVIVATGTRIAMETTLEASLAALFSEAPTPVASPLTAVPPPAAAPPPPAPTDVGGVARLVQRHYEKAQEHLRAGDWAKYGEELRSLERELQRLVRLTSP